MAVFLAASLALNGFLFFQNRGYSQKLQDDSGQVQSALSAITSPPQNNLPPLPSLGNFDPKTDPLALPDGLNETILANGLADLDPQIKSLTAAIASRNDMLKALADQIAQLRSQPQSDQNDAQIAELKNQVNALQIANQEDIIKLQVLFSQYQTNLDLISNMVKTNNDSMMDIIKNIK
jgi:hypothetical protein